MASHFSWFVKLLFLLLMLARAPTIDTRPASAAPTVDLIAGNEFLKLLFERDESQRELHSGEHDASERVVRGLEARSGSTSSSSTGAAGERRVTRADHYQSTGAATTQSSDLGNRGAAARSLSYKSRNVQNEATATTTAKTTHAEEGKQVVKLVTSGSKIVFLEEYDDNDAIVDAVARDIDLKKENTETHSKHTSKPIATEQVHMHEKSNPSDEVKVVAVSVSSSSKRGGQSRTTNNQYHIADTDMSKQSNKYSETRASMPHTDIMRQPYKQTPHDNSADKSHSVDNMSTMTATLTTTAPTATMTASATSTMDDFVNRSHKSEFSIEEAEPLTMSPQKLRGAPQAARANSPRSLHTPHAVSGRAVKMAANLDVVDSENSASTNIQNVLAAPLTQSASTRTAPAAYQNGSNKRNGTSAPINHSIANAARSHVNTQISGDDDMSDTVMRDTSAAVARDDAANADMDEKLLPFQTVIYHNTKEGHGPQSRSISYSSLSQNVEDLHAWRHTGILAEAQRNVSESLKPIHSAQLAHNSEPAKFYSVPSKMYSEPSKFYSEPAKVYSEPSKVYGEPEKFYSEPAKVYGQPSKFYSEPAKVYSQPAKVYGEPAKTYWSPSAAGAAVTASTSTSSSTSSSTTISTTTTRPGRYMPSRRPAIVSRIAFGEAQTSTAAPPQLLDEHPPVTISSIPTNQHQQQQHTHHTRFHSHTHSHSQSHGAHSSHGAHDSHSSVHTHLHTPANSQSHAETATQPAQSLSQSQSHSVQSQPRRVLFNLDKLPYDLLNAPQSPQHLLDPDFSHSPPAAVTYSSPRQRQCLESAFSASLSQSALQQQQQQQRQYSSLSDQHSNQNAKGLPNRDLVKCVSKYNQPLATSTATTESNHNGDDDNNDNDDGGLYTPTPEQNYEIEESVSVMTNGRAHGIQGIAAMTTTARPFAMRTTKFPNRGAIHHQQQHQQQHHYHGNANTNANIDNNYDDNVANIGGLDDDGIAGDGSKTGGGDDDDDAKVAYVVEGRNYRKYRVEEKTDDGFIVGEYGVVDHNDGNLRGVRYTADSTINRSLIQKALLTFLKLK
ncbi:serine-rich adhesin for platelets [Bactrocera oleae]|uniref:serine-rich adhesin for platelets n=1 Tax=Bactrocera oleae TaxID=104688 RepID=UPI00387E925B